MNLIKLKPEKNLHTNNYLFKYQDKVILVDTWFENIEKLLLKIDELWWKLDTIFLTHWHYDHIAWLELLIDKFPDVICYIHEKETIFLQDISYNYSFYYSCKFILDEKYFKNIHTYRDSDIINWIQVIHTPGHTIWSSCFYIPEENICFSWDTIFANWYWRYDLITWDLFELQKSLDKIYKLPWKTIIHSGHWPKWILENMGLVY